MYKNKFLILIFLVSLIWNTEINCNSPLPDSTEGQTLKMEYARIAYKEEKYQKALAILEENISLNAFHLETYLLLGDIYAQLNYPDKALRAYYFIIKKKHVPELLQLVSLNQVADILSQNERPKMAILETYLKIGIIWYRLFTLKKFSDSYQNSLIRQAKKYFFICNWYKYNSRVTAYYLAIIERDQQNYEVAYQNFKDFKKLSSENPYADPEEEGRINLLIADTLQKAGNYQKASVYLRDLHQNRSNSSSLKEYANSYLEAMHVETWSLGASLMGILDTNVHNLTAEEKENFTENEERLVQKHAFMWRKNLNFLYASKRYHNYSYLFTLQGKEDLNLENLLSSYDTREFSSSMEFNFDTYAQSLYKIKYQYLKTFIKLDNNSGFAEEKTKHTITPKYAYNLTGEHNMGQMVWGLPISFVNYSTTQNSTTELGISLSYRSFELSKYFAPVYSITLSTVGEETGSGNSAQMQLSATNLFSNFERTTILFTLEYLKNMNKDDQLSYTTFSLDLTLSRQLEKFKNLYFDSSLMYIISDEKALDVYNKWKIYGGLSYSI
ncbi:MAG: hypothetical protein A2202_07750 [Bdellovibrionales bacterium RIFOXYA1_FULL_36_14]|nr:MAG: hypothetical protein A2202_07750 [Bdellovibrionales bacterium RIFOXYA1_FULL_36_14]